VSFKKKTQKDKNVMAGTSNLPTNKVCDFAGFQGNKGHQVQREESQATPHSSFIHFISSMPTMSPSSILISKPQKTICKQFFDFYKISCSYYKSFL